MDEEPSTLVGDGVIEIWGRGCEAASHTALRFIVDDDGLVRVDVDVRYVSWSPNRGTRTHEDLMLPEELAAFAKGLVGAFARDEVAPPIGVDEILSSDSGAVYVRLPLRSGLLERRDGGAGVASYVLAWLATRGVTIDETLYPARA